MGTCEKLSILIGGGIVSASVNTMKYVAPCSTISTLKKYICPLESLNKQTTIFYILWKEILNCTSLQSANAAMSVRNFKRFTGEKIEHVKKMIFHPLIRTPKNK